MTLEMRGICKSFGSNDVLKHVDFSIQGGEICALLGENGAGKSTLMNILGGVLPADRGEIVIDGAAVHFRTPSDSLSAGVAFIHQELSLINDLAIYENMFIGRELKTKYGLLDAKTMIQKTQEVFDRLELHLDPRTMVRELDASYKQIVEISRAMMMEASLIIMDEPTTSLTDPEIERVFDMMRMLQKQNVAIVFISHKLKEVMEVCNRYTVLRDGNMVAAGPVAEVTTADLARFMVGHDVRTENLHQDKELGGEILRGEGLGDGAHFRDISFTVHAGEVLGVTGLLGDGRSELFQAVFGDLPYTGQLFMEGQPVKVTSTPQAIGWASAMSPATARRTASSRTWISWRTAPWSPSPGWPAGASSTSAAGTRSLTARWASCTSRWAKRPTSSPACPAATSRRWCWPNGCPPTPRC